MYFSFRPVIQLTKPKVTSHVPELKVQTTAPISLTLTPAAEPPARQQARKKGSTPRAEDSDTDPEAPVAQQMLSFVMDDPDFESEASDTPKITKVIRRKYKKNQSLSRLNQGSAALSSAK